MLALLAILAQLGSAWTFSGDGKADPGLAQRSVGRLFALGRRAEAARLATERLQSSSAGAPELRRHVDQLSVHLSYLEEGYVEAIEDWRIFHPYAVYQAEGSQNDDE